MRDFESVICEADLLTHFDEIVVSYSGGKDSTTCLLWALETGLPVRAVFCDTGNEPPETPEYLNYIEAELGVEIERVVRLQKNDQTIGCDRTFWAIVRDRGMWPIPGRCRVSSMCKRDAFKWHLKCTDTDMDRSLMILGQRRSESAARAKLPPFTPITRAGLSVYRPILDWTIGEVFEYLDTHEIDAHPAYAKGRKRVGCVWCVNSYHDDLVRDEELYPERCARLRALRTEIGLPSVPEGVRQATMFEPSVCQYEGVHCE